MSPAFEGEFDFPTLTRSFVEIDLNGVRLTDPLTANVNSAIGSNNSTSSFLVTFKNDHGQHSTTFSVGDEVIIYLEKGVNPPTQKIFTGIIEDVDYKGKGANEQVTIKGRDYGARLQDVTIEPSTYAGQEISVIITSIITNYVSDITTNNVQLTTKVKQFIAFNHKNVFDAIKQLADEVNYNFYVDIDKDLHFEPKGSTVSGVTIDNTNITGGGVKVSDQELYNRIWVYGDRSFVGFKEDFIADGGSLFTLQYKPSDTSIVVAGSITKGGVLNLTSEAGSNIAWLADYQNKTVTFVSGTLAGNNIPVSGGSVIINYQKQVPIVKFARDAPSIAQFGPKEKVIVDRNIKEPNEARDLAKSELVLGKDERKQGIYTLEDVVYLVPGNTIQVNLPNQDLTNQQYDILSVKYNITKKTLLSNQIITVKVNSKLKDMTDTIKQMMLDIKEIKAGDSTDTEGLTRLEFSTGSLGVRVKTWNVKTRDTGSSFLLGNAIFGVLGSPAQQPVLGSGTAATFALITSGGEL